MPSIDIVIPSFRVEENYLLPILSLKAPVGWQVFFYLIIDNPQQPVPETIKLLQQHDNVKVVVNETNMGHGATRNRGIMMGDSKWILLLDDDILPNSDLLFQYINAIIKNPDAIGFVGVTNFPKPCTAATKALVANGAVGQFQIAKKKDEVVWAPTANVMLNRNKIAHGMFDVNLKAGGEDIELLSRSSFLFNEKYISVPNAQVLHPWWDKGSLQTKRMFRYGIGASQIAQKEPIKYYTYKTFPNTIESIIVLFLFAVLAAYTGLLHWVYAFATAIILSEILTNWMKCFIIGKSASLKVALCMAWSKNCYEIGYLFGSIQQNRLNGFFERIELGFSKKHPGWFRTNRWIIIKLVLIVTLLFIYSLYQY